MQEIRFTQSMAGMPTPTGRRGAAHAVGMALLAALGLRGSSAARKKRRKRRKKGGSPGPSIASVVVEGASSAGLPVATGSIVGSQASCSGPGRLLGGGYIVNGSAEKQVNLLVVESAPNLEAETFIASLYRTTDVGSTAGAWIVAYALCID